MIKSPRRRRWISLYPGSSSGNADPPVTISLVRIITALPCDPGMISKKTAKSAVGQVMMR